MTKVEHGPSQCMDLPECHRCRPFEHLLLQELGPLVEAFQHREVSVHDHVHECVDEVVGTQVADPPVPPNPVPDRAEEVIRSFLEGADVPSPEDQADLCRSNGVLGFVESYPFERDEEVVVEDLEFRTSARVQDVLLDQRVNPELHPDLPYRLDRGESDHIDPGDRPGGVDREGLLDP